MSRSPSVVEAARRRVDALRKAILAGESEEVEVAGRRIQGVQARLRRTLVHERGVELVLRRAGGELRGCVDGRGARR